MYKTPLSFSLGLTAGALVNGDIAIGMGLLVLPWLIFALLHTKTLIDWAFGIDAW